MAAAMPVGRARDRCYNCLRMQHGEDFSEIEVYAHFERGQVRVGWLEGRPGKGSG